MRGYLKYLIVIAALAAALVVMPASRPAEANGSFGLSFSVGIPLYYSYPAYPGTWGYDRPYGYWGGPYGYRGGYYDWRPRHVYPRHRYYYPRHFRGHRGYDRWGYDRW